jgi:Xaa-Pro aminopeptidase
MIQLKFNTRRQRLLAKMAPANAAVIFYALKVTCSAYSNYSYR